jgi:hypothetical protein
MLLLSRLMVLGWLMVGIVGVCLMVGSKTTVTSGAGARFSMTPAPKRGRFHWQHAFQARLQMPTKAFNMRPVAAAIAARGVV